MAYSFANNPLLRKHFAKVSNIIDIPNLIDIQKTSYKRFLQADLPSSARKPSGLEAVFRSVFPIRDFSDTCSMEYVSYGLGTPKYDVEECQQRDMTYSAPLKVTMRLIVFDTDEDTGAKSVKDIKERVLAELDDEFAKDAGEEFKTLDEFDRVLDVSSVDVMRPLLPHAKVVIMKETGHLPMLERPTETAAHYRTFLED